MGSHILADLNVKCPDDGYPKLDIFTSELVLDSHEYVSVAYVAMHCVI